METIHENELAAAQANVALAAAVAAANGDWQRVRLPDETLAKATELVYPEGVRVYSASLNNDRLFGKMKSMRRLVVPNGDISLCDYYFRDFPAEEVEITFSAFRHSFLLYGAKARRVTVTAPAVDPKPYGHTQFFKMPNLESVDFEEGVKYVPAGLCKECAALKRVGLPNTIKTIDGHAFEQCAALRDIEFPSGLEEIMGYAFHKCAALEEADIGKAKCGPNAFSHSGLVNLKCDSRNIGERAFYFCDKLENVEFGPDVREIGKQAFMFAGMKSVVVPENVAIVDDKAFANCVNLEKASLENGYGTYVTTRYIFADCTRLTDVYISWRAGYNETRNFVASVGLERRDYEENRVKVWYSGDRAAEFGKKLFRTPARIEERPSDGTIIAEFPGGLRLSDADALQGAIAGLGPGAEIEMAGDGGRPLKQISDLSEVKVVIVRFPESK